ncbi:DUF1801 domain-containing protein [Winogradskyella flava]|uniref:DUF1801 domain-containing protein n=1 Tax=Winogradskyella flava TaxID=1884876 RepID=A0A842ITK5_9FLAO|nr:DUF1801 domain-containing protein [Winogradskyella flava]MBC2845116.1 DUF1801 domain-containing protein [Winogradskyella flava]
MEAHPELHTFLKPYSQEIQDIVWALRNFVVNVVPEANELIWDNYNALAMAYSKSEQLKDAFCHISVYAKHVNFGFNRGAELSKASITLNGKGKLIRHIKVTNLNTFPKKDLKPMIWEALGISEQLNPGLGQRSIVPKSIVMSISEKKLRPN